MPTPQHAALDKAISGDRYAAYLSAAGGDLARARDLYVWDRDLSMAIMADVAVVEVALRNAVHNAFSNRWGPFWYERIADVVLDDRSASQLARAWGTIPRGLKQNSHDLQLPGRLVAHCMFGFWVNLMDAGAHAGKEPRRINVDYEDLWRNAMHSAFPGGKAEARNDPNPKARFTRAWTHGIAKNVNTLRNRVAHHEPLLNGFPLPGQATRMTSQQGHDQYLKLARMIDRDLAAWISGNTQVTTLLANRP